MVLAFGREGYRRWDLRLPDLAETIGYRGFQRLAARYWRTGSTRCCATGASAALWRLCSASCRQSPPTAWSRAGSYIRAQALAPDCSMVDDFVFHQDEAIIHVRNAPSPAATSSLMIGEAIRDMAAKQFALT